MTARLLGDDDLRLLGAMLRSPTGVDGPAFCAEHGAKPARVAASVKRLRELGCRIEPLGLTGLRLARSGLSVWGEYLEAALAAAGSARRVEVFRRTASTQEIVRARGAQPVVALADEQTAGRGRLGRAWLAPPGACVLFSLNHPVPARQSDPSE